MNKEEFRLEMRAKRRALANDDVSRLSRAIQNNLFTLDALKDAKSVCVFISSFKEPDTSAIITRLLESGKTVSAPVSDTETNTLSLVRINGTDDLREGAYGIPEPSGGETVSDADAILVPGLSFDRRGARMGFGKGYYDRLLSSMGAVRIGLCYGFQLLEAIPSEEHDTPMDYIITEKEILEIGLTKRGKKNVV